MTGSWNFCGVIVLLYLFPFNEGQGQKTLTVLYKSPNTTYVTLGNTLILNVTYGNNGGGRVAVEWRNNRGLIAEISRNNVSTTEDSRATIEMNSNLVLKSTELRDNGTYEFRANPVNGRALSLEFTVIIQDRGEPQIECFDKGVTSFCECKGVGGNPPSLASWLKEDERITGPEYLRSELRQEDVVGRKQGIYTCEVQNGNLKVGKNVTLSIPTNLSIEATRQPNTVKITCKADAKPAPDYMIYRNGTRLSVEDGEATHEITGSVEQYKCVARNIFGNVSETRNYTVSTLSTESPVTTETSSTSSPPSGNETVPSPPKNTQDDSGLGPGAIAGIVIGILLAIIVAVGLVYCCYFKNSNEQGVCGCTKKEDTGEGDQAVNHGVSPYGQPSRGENPYESVDAEKINSDQQGGPSGDTSPPPEGNSGGLPPVYAVVDKNKKTKKPPPKSQPPSVTYASLDPVDLQPDSSKMRDRSREETNYADIDLGKLQSDLV